MYNRETLYNPNYLAAAKKQLALAEKARDLHECRNRLEGIQFILKDVFALYIEISRMEHEIQGYVSGWKAEGVFEGQVRFFNGSDHVYFGGAWYPISKNRKEDI